MIKRYTKKPVTVDVMLYNEENLKELIAWLGKAYYGHVRIEDTYELSYLLVNTLEGVIYATPGDYIIKGVKGEFYPCKPDAFALTYSEYTKKESEDVNEVLSTKLNSVGDFNE